MLSFQLSYLQCHRIVDHAKYQIIKIIDNYSIFGAVNLMVAYLTPVIERNKRLPYIMYVPFAIDETAVGFYVAYLYQFGNVLYAGGINIAVNMYLFSAFTSVNCFLSLLSSRVRCLGYPNGVNEMWTNTPTHRKSFYKEICECIEMHLKIDRLTEEISRARQTKCNFERIYFC